MATIITLHGTGATGLEAGDRWWQRGSGFEAHMRELLEGADGTLNFQPCIWDGANRETSRRQAAKALLARMREHEKREEAYALIGHSHGGSVIAMALLEAAGRPSEYSRLSCWITVGTPFIRFERLGWTFSKLSTAGKTAYLALLFVCSFLFIFSNIHVLFPEYVQARSIGWIVAVMEVAFFLVAFAPFFLFVAVQRVRLSRRLIQYRGAQLRSAKHAFGAQWMALYHANDEAVQSLSVLRQSRIDFFPKDFAVQMLTVGMLCIAPAVMLALATSQEATSAAAGLISKWEPGMANLAERTRGDAALDVRGYFWNLYIWMFVVLFSGIFPAYILQKWSGIVINYSGVAVVDILIYIALLGVIVGLLFAEFLLVLLVARKCAGYLSTGLSGVLNRLTWRQVTKSAFGNDTLGEHAAGADTHPAWLVAGRPPLPRELGDEISDASNVAASAAIAKFRGALQFRSGDNAISLGRSLFADVLTWEELVHTSYFNVPRFRKLVAYALTQGGGFRATDAFKADPDYARVQGWFETIRAGDRSGIEAV